MLNEKKMPRKVMNLVEEATKDVSTETRFSLIEQAVLYYRPNYKNCESFRGNFIPIVANVAINTADSIMRESAVTTSAHYFSRWVYEDSVRRIADVTDFLEILLKANFNGEKHDCAEVNYNVASFMVDIEASIYPTIPMSSYMSNKVDRVMDVHFSNMREASVIVQKIYRNSPTMSTEEAIHRAVSSLRTITRKAEKMSMEYAIDCCSHIITPSKEKRTDVLNNARIAVRATLVASAVHAISTHLISVSDQQKDDSKTRRACMNRVAVGLIHYFITDWKIGILRYLSSDAYPDAFIVPFFPKIPDSVNRQNHTTK